MQRFWNLLGYNAGPLFSLRLTQASIEAAAKRGDEDLIAAVLANKHNPVTFDNQKLVQIAVDAQQFGIFKLLLTDPRFDLSLQSSNLLETILKLENHDFFDLAFSQPNIDPSFKNNCVLIYLHNKSRIKDIYKVISHPKFQETPTIINMIKIYRDKLSQELKETKEENK